jgi:aldehyde dehydrogenase (NAD+)
MDNIGFQELFKSHKQFFHSGQTRSLEFRIEALRKLKTAIQQHEKDILDALLADLNKSTFDAYATEIGIIHDEINFAIQNIHSWAKPQKVHSPILMWPSKSYIRKEPFGVTLIIAPWNYPFQLLLAPLVGAIGAGNTAILKPSEISVNTANVIEKLINSAFPEEYIRVVQGAVAETQSLLELPFDYIFFTGSTTVGKVVAGAAAKNLTPTTLELGGKSPAIVYSDAKLKLAAKKIAWGKFLNSGQTCIAPDYVLIQRDIRDAFIKEMAAVIHEFYGQEEASLPPCCKIINDRNFQRLAKLIDPQKVVYGGQTNAEKRQILPTLLADVTWDDAVMQEEIFGPILPVIIYDTIDEVINAVNNRSKPLALYLFTESDQVKNRIQTEISFGGGAINNTLLQISSHFLPFGGVGSSGIGSYHGKASFDTFTHQKSLVESSSSIDLGLIYPNKQLSIKTLKRIVPSFRP